MSVGAGAQRRVVFHADDFGMNSAVNQGILLAFRDGLLTSTSVLANAPSADAACREWQPLIAAHCSGALPSGPRRQQLADPASPFDLGIHLNLTQGRPLTADRYPAGLLDRDGNFPGIGKLFFGLRRATATQLQSVGLELQAQIEWMCDRELRPTHLNGHQYVELIPAVSAMIPQLLDRYAISTVRVAREPDLLQNVLFQGDVAGWGLGLVKRFYASAFRHRITGCQASFPDRFFGTSHAGRVDLPTLVRFLRRPNGPGLTEIGLHPGTAPSTEESYPRDPWFDPLCHLRPNELQWMCGNELTTVLTSRGIQLSRLRSQGTPSP
jgi:predicted glycoside hydrolase/deacetylase ChbG (UPF0249 family)